ncbi:MAG: class I SAM-dependent methyltransferase [Burkholderiales bacterium]
MKPACAVPGAAALVLIALIAGAAAAQTVDRHQHRFSDAEKWAQVFDDPARDAWQKPDEVIRALKLPPDALVADIGSGTGYFAVRLARAVPKGKVYGVDAESDMVRYLGERAQREGLSNIAPVAAAGSDPRIPAPVDLVIVVDTYHHIPSRERYFRNLQKSLKPGGRLAIIDFTPDSPVGPPKRARIPAETVKKELGRAGYGLREEHAFLPNQYFLVFQPREQ